MPGQRVGRWCVIVTSVMTQHPCPQCPHPGGRTPVVSGLQSWCHGDTEPLLVSQDRLRIDMLVWRELPSLTLEAIKLFVWLNYQQYNSVYCCAKTVIGKCWTIMYSSYWLWHLIQTSLSILPILQTIKCFIKIENVRIMKYKVHCCTSQ